MIGDPGQRQGSAAVRQLGDLDGSLLAAELRRATTSLGPSALAAGAPESPHAETNVSLSASPAAEDHERSGDSAGLEAVMGRLWTNPHTSPSLYIGRALLPGRAAEAATTDILERFAARFSITVPH